MIPIKCDSIKMTSNYGKRSITVNGKVQTGFHHGIDIIPIVNGKKDNNGEILAFADGIVTNVQKRGKQYGNACHVRIDHGDGLYTYYCHLKDNSIKVNVGDHVVKGDILGIIGTTGNSTGIHLHFQIDHGSAKTSINPYDCLFNNVEIYTPEKKEENKEESLTYNKDLILNLVKRTIRGDFGNGEVRKQKLGKYYNDVQKQVNLNVKNKTTQWGNIKIYE